MVYVILGGGGQLGREMARRLGSQAVVFTRRQADLESVASWRAAVAATKPDVVINCAAFNFVDRAESEPASALAVNTFGVRDLAILCRDLNCFFVHFSTNYVFGLDEPRRTPYLETDIPGPVNVYGLSKLAGELAIRALCPRHLIIRTCGLFGPGGNNFVVNMLRQASLGPIRVVNDQICTPTSAADLAAAVEQLWRSGVQGLFHLTNAGECSWHEFARVIFQEAGLKVDLQPCSSAAFQAPARRPAYSVLANQAFTQLGLPPLRPWRDALAEFLHRQESA